MLSITLPLLQPLLRSKSISQTSKMKIICSMNFIFGLDSRQANLSWNIIIRTTDDSCYSAALIATNWCQNCVDLINLSPYLEILNHNSVRCPKIQYTPRFQHKASPLSKQNGESNTDTNVNWLRDMKVYWSWAISIACLLCADSSPATWCLIGCSILAWVIDIQDLGAVAARWCTTFALYMCILTVIWHVFMTSINTPFMQP